MSLTEYDPQQPVEGGFSDVALVPSPTTPGKMTFAWGPDGDLVFDKTCAYAVLMCVASRKGTYQRDGSYGTRVRAVVQDGSATGSRLSSYARDAGPQLSGIVSDFSATATRARTGRWNLTLRWTAAGSQQNKGLEF